MAARELRALARLHGIQVSYTDGLKQKSRASDDAVVAVLRVMGAPLDDVADVPDALRAETDRVWRTVCEPVAVAWEGSGGAITARCGARAATASVEVTLEAGGARAWRTDLAAAEVVEEHGGRVARALPLPGDLPLGYHRLSVTIDGRSGEALLIAAPTRARQPARKTWGVFAPLYALRSETNWGIGNLGDLRALLAFVADRGGSLVATLPLHAAFLDEPFEPSPYSPASRLWWNELHLDLTTIPEVRRTPSEVEVLRKSEYVEHARLARAIRAALEEARRALSAGRRPALEAFVAERPHVRDYARFCALTEALGPWPGWRAPQTSPQTSPDAATDYHVYAQFLMHEQLEAVRADARARDAGLYLDMPLGVHPAGFDVWAHQDLFAVGVAGGAPPDAFFTKGQNWSFPPMIPERVRASGYGYPLAAIRTLLRYATVLRVDHVIGLHRLFWIPEGFDASDGVFVRWPDPQEWYAILALESHRSGATIIGEDLGTVPRAVRASMARHGIARSYVVQEEFTDDAEQPVRTPPARALAALNTHDMPPFASWWTEHDLVERVERGLMTLEEDEAERHLRARRRRRLVDFLRAQGLPADSDPLGAVLAWLADGRAHTVIAALEDLWGEIEPQNRPGTTTEYPNWRRKSRVPLEDLAGNPDVVTRLEMIAERRGRRPNR